MRIFRLRTGAIALFAALLLTTQGFAAGDETPRSQGPTAELSLGEIEIHGEILVPQAVYIIADVEDDEAAVATVLEYLDYLETIEDRLGLVLILGGFAP
jgi:hypothetical protein